MSSVFSVEDRVEVLDEQIEGRVIGFNNNYVIVETEDGFHLEFSENELVKINYDEIIVDQVDINKVIKEEHSKNNRPKISKKRSKVIPPMEVDLHIHQITSNTKNLSNFEIINIQLDTAKRQLEFAVHKRIQKIVFIHGVGQGVLKAELKTLFSRYDNLKFYDADYKEYGLGATEVYIYQNN
ncbi:hypothetical protein SAMN04488096_104294 [Mesonia phycicola]|uniref:Smr domain-containing protein n=1 Tax=Mesonia phycicola TaxID=579105 RepID=A0A1M6E0Y5_9FLAO|nr:Smr/MutS family protein [Mesonia phycicola]SHI79167.1 hypothetical protein SAMN04488096_104294 [Mesonia phycicola]